MFELAEHWDIRENGLVLWTMLRECVWQMALIVSGLNKSVGSHVQFRYWPGYWLYFQRLLWSSSHHEGTGLVFVSVPYMPVIQSFDTVIKQNTHTTYLPCTSSSVIKLKDYQYTQLFGEHPAVCSIRILCTASCVRLEVFRVVKCSVVLWVTALCSVVGWYHCCRWKYCLYLEGKREVFVTSVLYMNAGHYIKMYCRHPLQLVQCVFYNDWPLGPILRLWTNHTLFIFFGFQISLQFTSK